MPLALPTETRKKGFAVQQENGCANALVSRSKIRCLFCSNQLSYQNHLPNFSSSMSILPAVEELAQEPRAGQGLDGPRSGRSSSL
jgi:hypothetical protein